MTAQTRLTKLTYLKSGKILDTTLWVITARVTYNGSDNYINTIKVDIDWNIHVKSND